MRKPSLPISALATVVAPPRILSVTELTHALKGLLEENFGRVLVRGEVSGFRGAHAASGHLYFALKDGGACLDTKMWASSVPKLKFALSEGLEVIAEGYLDIYEKT